RYMDDKCLTLYQTTELWLKTEGVWKIATAHMSTQHCDPMPWQPPHPALSDVRAQSKPTKFLSTEAETELRELLSKLHNSGLRSDSDTDVFTSDFVFTDTRSNLSADRNGVMDALKVPTIKNRERYRDDEVFLRLGNAAIYGVRIRSFPKDDAAAPPRPIVYSVMFVRSGSEWKIAAAHASEITD